MPICSVVGCSHRRGATDSHAKFFRFPKLRENQGEETREVCAKRRWLWKKAINRKLVNEAQWENTIVCSDHFVGGLAAYHHDYSSPAWIPSLRLGYEKNTTKLWTTINHCWQMMINKHNRLNKTTSNLTVTQVNLLRADFLKKNNLPSRHAKNLTSPQRGLDVEPTLAIENVTSRDVSLPARLMGEVSNECFAGDCCHTEETTKCMFLRFPQQNAALRKQWVLKSRGTVSELRKDSKLCSCHFLKSDVTRKSCPQFFKYNQFGNIKLRIQSWPFSFLRNLLDMRNDNVLCDVTIVTKNNEELRCHSVVLAAGSPVLQRTIRSESKSAKKISGMRITTAFSGASWNAILDLFYTGHLVLLPSYYTDCVELLDTLAVPHTQQALAGFLGEKSCRSEKYKNKTVTTAVEKPLLETVTTSAVEKPPVEAVTTSAVEKPPVEAVTTSAVEKPPVKTVTTSAVEKPPAEAVTTSAVEKPPVETVTTSAVQKTPVEVAPIVPCEIVVMSNVGQEETQNPVIVHQSSSHTVYESVPKMSKPVPSRSLHKVPSRSSHKVPSHSSEKVTLLSNTELETLDMSTLDDMEVGNVKYGVHNLLQREPGSCDVDEENAPRFKKPRHNEPPEEFFNIKQLSTHTNAQPSNFGRLAGDYHENELPSLSQTQSGIKQKMLLEIERSNSNVGPSTVRDTSTTGSFLTTTRCEASTEDKEYIDTSFQKFGALNKVAFETVKTKNVDAEKNKLPVRIIKLTSKQFQQFLLQKKKKLKSDDNLTQQKNTQQIENPAFCTQSDGTNKASKIQLEIHQEVDRILSTVNDESVDSNTNDEFVELNTEDTLMDTNPTDEFVHSNSPNCNSQTVLGNLNNSNDLSKNLNKTKEDLEHISPTYEKNLTTKVFKCSTCGKICASLHALKIHNYLHNAEKFSCEKCSKIFPSSYHLKHHLRLVHPSSSSRFQCARCDKSFKIKSGLTHHIRFEHDTEGKMNECTICGKAFRFPVLLRQHMDWHNDTPQYPCDLCDKFFYSKAKHQSHLATHSDERNFQCSICSEKFKHNSTLRQHMQNHYVTGAMETTYDCDQCDRTFRQKKNLLAHVRAVHLRQYKYFCDVCEKSFSRNTLLKEHLTTSIHAKNVVLKASAEQSSTVELSTVKYAFKYDANPVLEYENTLFAPDATQHSASRQLLNIVKHSLQNNHEKQANGATSLLGGDSQDIQSPCLDTGSQPGMEASDVGDSVEVSEFGVSSDVIAGQPLSCIIADGKIQHYSQVGGVREHAIGDIQSHDMVLGNQMQSAVVISTADGSNNEVGVKTNNSQLSTIFISQQQNSSSVAQVIPATHDQYGNERSNLTIDLSDWSVLSSLMKTPEKQTIMPVSSNISTKSGNITYAIPARNTLATAPHGKPPTVKQLLNANPFPMVVNETQFNPSYQARDINIGHMVAVPTSTPVAVHMDGVIQSAQVLTNRQSNTDVSSNFNTSQTILLPSPCVTTPLRSEQIITFQSPSQCAQLFRSPTSAFENQPIVFETPSPGLSVIQTQPPTNEMLSPTDEL